MTKAEQRRFVRELAKNAVKELLAKSKKWPKEWDGHELRALLEKEFTACNTGQCGTHNYYINDRAGQTRDRRRRREFLNTCLVENL